MKHLLPISAAFAAFLLILNSCNKDDLSHSNDGSLDSIYSLKSELIVLGDELEDPYAITNMQLAYSNLKSSNPETPDFKVEPTHTYIRFLPKNEVEWEVLKSDTTIVLYDFPLNYEIANMGTYYHDPSLPDTCITYQYCVLPIDYKIPNIEHEILYEVFIPSTEDEDDLKSSSTFNRFLLDLEDESVRLTGHANKNADNLKSINRLLPSKWTPKGKIRIWDSSLGWLPLVQACVHARWLTHIETTLTDWNGEFQTDQFRYEVNYAIKWERPDFDIRSGNWGQAWFNGPKQKGDWNHDIDGGMSLIYAHIHRGAYTYYYNNSFGIKTPPKDDGLLNQRIHIGAMDSHGTSHYYDFNKFWLSPQIKIYAFNSLGNWNIGKRIFGTTVHELAHASHWEIGYTYGQYVVDAIFSEPYLPESWAKGVEAVITTSTYNSAWEWDQDRTLSDIIGNGGYTPIVWDMIDDYNQRVEKGPSYPIDNVSGYNLTQLENALYGNNHFLDWRNAIKNNYDNPTESFLNELFSNY